MKIKFFEMAKKVSYLSDHPQHKMGCAITKGNNLISLGTNKVKTHPQSKTPYQALHAELSAVLKANKIEVLNSTVYIYRETKLGNPGNARPCHWCMEMLRSAGVKDIYYTIDEAPFFKHEEIV